MIMNNSNINAPEYFSYPRELENYKKFKPLLTALVTLLLTLIFEVVLFGAACVLTVISGADLASFTNSFRSYDTMDNYSAIGALVSMGTIAVLIPALFLAMKITKERPVHTLTSTRGGWNKGFFMKGVLIGLVVNGIPQLIIAAFEGGFSHINIRYTLPGFIIFALLVPFQCSAEEYIFRGFIGQTVGSWFKKPVVAIVVSTILFMILHGYNGLGQSAIFVTGVVFCLVAGYTKGLEVGCAFHFVNNFFAFLLSGLGVSAVSSQTKMSGMIEDILINVAMFAAVIFMDKKLNWFKLDAPAEDKEKAEEENVAS